MKPRIFVYKMTSDNGGAPCVRDGLLSLAICKPQIRKSAQIGDLLFGFGAANYKRRLLYAAVVTRKCCKDEYYKGSAFSGRPDRIYKNVAGRPKRRANAIYHTDKDIARDVGRRFEKGQVLLSDCFRYLGSEGTCAYQKNFQSIAKLIKAMGRSYRVNHDRELYEKLLKLKECVWKQNSQSRIPPPTSPNKHLPCNRDGAGRG